LATIARLIAPAVALAGCGVALAHGRGGVGTSGTGTAEPARTVTGTSTTGLPNGTAAQQTHPWIRPRVGHAHTNFVVHLTLATAAGHVGVAATSYLVQLAAPRGAVPRCSRPTNIAAITMAPAHAIEAIPLGAPAAGWCAGRYRVTVFLQRGPYCPARLPGQLPVPCPEFATQALNVGTAHFRVEKGR
jgi:hypothetical protein